MVNFAAESHVDRSIDSPEPFIQTNVVGTLRLLNCARRHWARLPEPRKNAFRFLHVSTDEVYGTLAPADPAFTEETPFAPNSPYAASKAASDHLVRAYHHTYQLPVLTTNCSNNYGPYHFPEKLIPLMILNAIEGKPLPVYGDGRQIRDWLYVEDHAAAIWLVLRQGRVGETYNIGGLSEKPNIEIVQAICALLDRKCPRARRPVPRGPDHLRDRPPRTRPAVRHQLLQASAGARTGLRANRSPQASKRPSTGTSRTANGPRTSRPGNTPASGWAQGERRFFGMAESLVAGQKWHGHLAVFRRTSRHGQDAHATSDSGQIGYAPDKPSAGMRKLFTKRPKRSVLKADARLCP